jgi:MerR family transcriptional regulator/heat shock protein HspR
MAQPDVTRRIIPRDIVAQELAVPAKTLVRYERLGLVEVVHEGQAEGYEPAQVRRIWMIASFQRDLGINLAGVEVILRLCDRMTEVHHRLGSLAQALDELLEAEERADPDTPRPRSHD